MLRSQPDSVRMAVSFLVQQSLEQQAAALKQQFDGEVASLTARFTETEKQRAEFAAKTRAMAPENPVAPAPPAAAPSPVAPAGPSPELVALIRQIANEVAVSAIRDHTQQAVPVAPQPLPMPFVAPASPVAWPQVNPSWPAYNPHSRRW